MYAVEISVAGPIRDLSDGKRFAGAYSQRFVLAHDKTTAAMRAIDKLRREPAFARLRNFDGTGAPKTTVRSVRRARWHEGLFNNKALVLCRGPRRHTPEAANHGHQLGRGNE
jgi:hypothetical protein